MAAKLVVLASGRGSHFKNILEAIKAGEIDARVEALVVSRSKAFAREVARQYEVPDVVMSQKDCQSYESWDARLAEVLESLQPDLVVLAGFTKKLGPKVLNKLSGKIINIHPSLLPKFGGQGMYGKAVHEAVLQAGESYTGASVHFVDGEYDHGAVISQTKVKVDPSDTAESLAARVLKAEHRLYVKAIARILAKRSS